MKFTLWVLNITKNSNNVSRETLFKRNNITPTCCVETNVECEYSNSHLIRTTKSQIGVIFSLSLRFVCLLLN